MVRATKTSSQLADGATLAHEFNNDLGIIIAECDLLESMLTKEEAATSTRLNAIRTAVHRMADRISACPWPASPPSHKSGKSFRPS